MGYKLHYNFFIHGYNWQKHGYKYDKSSYKTNDSAQSMRLANNFADNGTNRNIHIRIRFLCQLCSPTSYRNTTKLSSILCIYCFPLGLILVRCLFTKQLKRTQ